MESRSPYGRLRSVDSCSAVLSAMTHPFDGHAKRAPDRDDRLRVRQLLGIQRSDVDSCGMRNDRAAHGGTLAVFTSVACEERRCEDPHRQDAYEKHRQNGGKHTS